MIQKRSGLLPLQKAIFDRVNRFLAPRAKGYDYVPDNARFPYWTIGEDTANDFSGKVFGGQEVTATLHAFSEYKGAAEVKELIDLIIQAVSAEPLDLSAWGFSAIFLGAEFISTYEESATVRHGVVRLRFKIFQN